MEVWEEDGLVLDDLLDIVYANDQGFYSSSAVSAGDDVYVLVKWEFQLTQGNDDPVVRIVDMGSGKPFVAASTFESRQSLTENNVTIDTTIAVNMPQAQPEGLGTLVARIGHTLDYIRGEISNSPIPVSWNADYNIPVHILTDSFNRASSEIYISLNTFNVQGTSRDQVTLFHEMGHVVHHNHSQVPDCDTSADGIDGHWINSEEQPTCALIEGYASYLGVLAAKANQPSIVDPFYDAYRDNGVNIPNLGLSAPQNGLWRGNDATGLGSTYESGEVVEGAFSGVQFGIHDAFGFVTNFKAMAGHDPENAFEFLQALVRDADGDAKIKVIYKTMQTHGIVYNRVQFTDDPFDEEEPPDQAPPSEGNRKEIDNKMFLRGKVTTEFEDVASENLGVEEALENERVAVGYKSANGGLNDAPSTFTSFTSSSDFGFFSGSIDLDTKSFGGTSGDGEWDLVIRAENEDQFHDNFLPSWDGDANATVNTNERYLKKLGTWYDRDRDPATEDDGKVVVDNTAPKVENFKPNP